MIGRNEGDRLRVCLESVLSRVGQTIYVDSGSSDSSIAIAQELGVEVVELDTSFPFTAARARNFGYQRLKEKWPTLKYVQFVDGDCDVDPDWIETAVSFLGNNNEIAVVCGRRRERFPDSSVYNLLCDIEWSTPAGESLSCGGDAMMRIDAFSQVNGYRNDLIAGEEPELCVRLRSSGWKIWRLENEMTLHDANMARFSQWWKRAMRGGFTYAQGASELGRQCQTERNRALFWGGFLPTLTVIAYFVMGETGLLLLASYPLQYIRLTFKSGLELEHRLPYCLFLVIGKFPEMLGIIKYYFNHVFGITNRLIEYK